MTSGIFLVLGLAVLPAVANFTGGLLAEWFRPSRLTLNRALHAATGTILAVVAIDFLVLSAGLK